MDIILRKFKAGKIRLTFNNSEELKELLIYLSEREFELVDSIINYLTSAKRHNTTNIVCERGCLYTSDTIREGIKYISYKEFFGVKYDMPSKDSLMDFLGE